MRSLKTSFSTIEAITHFDGPLLDGERKKRSPVSNKEEVTFLSYGFLRRDDFYPLDIANIIAKYLIHHRLIMTFKQSSEFLAIADRIHSYDEANQRRTVLFTPNIKQLPFIKDIPQTVGIGTTETDNNGTDNDDTYHINFDFKMLHHDCDVRNGAWYSNKGYFIQCGIITIPKTDANNLLVNKKKEKESTCNTFINKFAAIDADTLINYTGKVELGYIATKLIPKADIQADYTFLAIYSQGKYQHASIGHNTTPSKKRLRNNDYNEGLSIDERYVLETNDSLTVSITRKKVQSIKNEETDGNHDTGDHDNDENDDDGDSCNYSYNYKYSLSYMKNCDKSKIFLEKESPSEKIPFVMDLDCEKNDYFIGMTSVACSCDTRGFEYEVNVC